MININGNEYAIDNTQLTLVKNQLINQLQDKKITWNGEEKLLTTVLQEIHTTASGKSNIIVVDTLPSTLTANSQYWTKKKADGTGELTTGRHIYIVDALKASTYVGTSEVDLSAYVNKTDILTSKNTSATDEQVYSAKAVNDNFLQLSGGTMSGSIVTPKIALKREIDTDGLHIYGGTDNSKGSSVQLTGKDNTSNAGVFWIKANNGTNSKLLHGKPDGTLTWGSNDISGDVIDITSEITWKNISSGKYKAYLCGNMVQLILDGLKPSADNTIHFIGQVPTKYKPRFSTNSVVVCNASGIARLFQTHINLSVMIYNAKSAENYCGQLIYFI